MNWTGSAIRAATCRPVGRLNEAEGCNVNDGPIFVSRSTSSPMFAHTLHVDAEGVRQSVVFDPADYFFMFEDDVWHADDEGTIWEPAPAHLQDALREALFGRESTAVGPVARTGGSRNPSEKTLRSSPTPVLDYVREELRVCPVVAGLPLSPELRAQLGSTSGAERPWAGRMLRRSPADAAPADVELRCLALTQSIANGDVEPIPSLLEFATRLRIREQKRRGVPDWFDSGLLLIAQSPEWWRSEAHTTEDLHGRARNLLRQGPVWLSDSWPPAIRELALERAR